MSELDEKPDEEIDQNYLMELENKHPMYNLEAALYDYLFAVGYVQSAAREATGKPEDWRGLPFVKVNHDVVWSAHDARATLEKWLFKFIDSIPRTSTQYSPAMHLCFSITEWIYEGAHLSGSSADFSQLDRIQDAAELSVFLSPHRDYLKWYGRGHALKRNLWFLDPTLLTEPAPEELAPSHGNEPASLGTIETPPAPVVDGPGEHRFFNYGNDKIQLPPVMHALAKALWGQGVREIEDCREEVWVDSNPGDQAVKSACARLNRYFLSKGWPLHVRFSRARLSLERLPE